ncbi:MAG: DUF3343 domain-containing protein [Clostridia bacterium]|nr:DUF3343 domain-containing protein [Clostridia bacterium]
MAEIRVKVGSVTNAQKAKKVLLNNGIHAAIKRAVQIKKGDGCGYSVVFVGEREPALLYLKQAGIKIISVTANDIS